MAMVSLCITVLILLSSSFSCHSWCPTPPNKASEEDFQQRAMRFWEFEETTKRWVEISYPFDLMTCINGNCTKVASIERREEKQSRTTVTQQENLKTDCDETVVEGNFELVLPLRKRVSLTRMSEASIWVTGQSGSIYERFWNGVEWVIAPHELPTPAGHANSVFIVNQTILALSEAGMLYQVTNIL